MKLKDHLHTNTILNTGSQSPSLHPIRTLLCPPNSSCCPTSNRLPGRGVPKDHFAHVLHLLNGPPLITFPPLRSSTSQTATLVIRSHMPIDRGNSWHRANWASRVSTLICIWKLFQLRQSGLFSAIYFMHTVYVRSCAWWKVGDGVTKINQDMAPALKL